MISKKHPKSHSQYKSQAEDRKSCTLYVGGNAARILGLGKWRLKFKEQTTKGGMLTSFKSERTSGSHKMTNFEYELMIKAKKDSELSGKKEPEKPRWGRETPYSCQIQWTVNSLTVYS